MRAFAEQEIIIPSGPFEGRPFRMDRQPFSRHWFDAVDTGEFSEFIITGPSQSGKTLIGFVIPLLYHLFEREETVIAAAPDRDICTDKWEQDIEPVLMRTRYAELLPQMGKGSKGGRASSIKFRNGAILRWMTAGGGDKSRSAFTSRVVCMTETDGFDVRTSTSSEANKIKQIEARTRSYHRELRRIYKECTLTTEHGHTWQRYCEGTASRLVLPCPHCKQCVSPERDDLHGWQDADSDEEARGAAFFCPSCGAAWSEDERRIANEQCLLLHRGQELEGGNIAGDAPRTRTLGFRWSAVNNMLIPSGDIGVDEWAARRSPNEDDAERELCQFVWAIPYVPRDVETIELDPDVLRRRVASTGHGQVPEGTVFVTIGVDVNGPVLHWTAIAWRPDGSGVIFDYGRQGLKTKSIGFDAAIKQGLGKLQQRLGEGWTSPQFHAAAVDTRWQTDQVVAGIKSLGDKRWRPFMGLGAGQFKNRSFKQPMKATADISWIGIQSYEKYLAKHRMRFLFGDANAWKTWLQSRLTIEGDEQNVAGIRLYATSDASTHLEFAKHLTSEREVSSFARGKGHTTVWEPIRSANHWLDATYMACVVAHRLGLFNDKQRRPATPRPAQHERANDRGDHRDRAASFMPRFDNNMPWRS